MEAIRQLGQYATLLYQALRSILEFSTYRKNLFQEFVKIGYESIPIIMLTGVFTGAVLTLQTAYQLDTDIYPASIVGSIVGQSIIIELAAVIGALVLAGKVGARISTELGTMRVSEQIDALESMGFNSVTFLVVPRVLSGIFMFPVLYVIAAVTGISGGLLAGSLDGILPAAEFMQGAREFFFPEEREGALREKFFKVECARFQSKRVDEERKTSLRSKETTEGCSFPAVLSPLSVNSASKKVL